MEPLRILHEDARLLAVDKPSGALVIPGRGEGPAGPTLAEAASEHCGGKAFVVHRLDRGTSGVLVFAKDAAEHRRLCGLFERRGVEKTYLALARGAVKDGKLDAPLAAFGSGRMGVRLGGKPSETRWTVRERFKAAATLLEVRPLTGRRHQVRAHLYAAGHPIVGDPLYGPGADAAPKAGRLMLHAWKVAFPDEAGRRLELSVEPPDDFLRVVESLRWAA